MWSIHHAFTLQAENNQGNLLAEPTQATFVIRWLDCRCNDPGKDFKVASMYTGPTKTASGPGVGYAAREHFLARGEEQAFAMR